MQQSNEAVFPAKDSN